MGWVIFNPLKMTMFLPQFGDQAHQFPISEASEFPPMVRVLRAPSRKIDQTRKSSGGPGRVLVVATRLPSLVVETQAPVSGLNVDC